MKYTPNPMKTDDTAICTLTTYQSETIAFNSTKNAPSEITEGAFFCLNAGITQFFRAIGNGRECDRELYAPQNSQNREK